MSEKTVNMTRVSVSTVVELCQELGCSVKELKSYYKVTAPEYNNKCLYVGKAKRFMTRLDVSGFNPEEHPAIQQQDKDWATSQQLGAVRAQILPKEIREEETDVLEAVRVCVRGLLEDSQGCKLGERKPKDEHAADVQAANEEEVQEATA